MFSRSAVAIFIGIVAEFFAASWVIERAGFGTSLLLVIALGVFGITVIRWKAAGLLVSTLESATTHDAAATSQAAGRALGLLAGVLITLPGFLSSALGLVLLVPPLRRLVEPLLAVRATRLFEPYVNRSGPAQRTYRPGPAGNGTVIDVDIVEPDQPNGSATGDAADAPRSARPEVG